MSYVVKFRADGYTDPSKVLASNSPFSRKVDCSTLQVVEPGSRVITPREFPIATETQGDTKLKLLGGGQFRYRWQTRARLGRARAASSSSRALTACSTARSSASASRPAGRNDPRGARQRALLA